jgi:hypothetical protein
VRREFEWLASRSSSEIGRAKAGEPGGNRTHNPQIKSRIEKSKTTEIRMILREWCAERGIVTRIDVTQAAPDFSSRRTKTFLWRRRSRRVVSGREGRAQSATPNRSTTSEFARVRDLVAADRSNLRGFNGHDSCRVAIDHRELDFVRFSIVVHVHDRTDVARYQRLFRDRLGEDDSIEFDDHVP